MTDVVWPADHSVVLARLALRVAEVTPARITTGGPVVGETLRAAGFGRTADTWVPDQLRSTNVAVQSVADSDFTVVAPGAATASACKGDAGGPVVRESAGAVTVVGLLATSRQRGCWKQPDAGDGAGVVRVDTRAGWISSHMPGLAATFGSVYAGAAGIGGSVLSSDRDRVVPFDFDHSGKLDHLVVYRPGDGALAVVKHAAGGGFERVYSGTGLGGFDLSDARDQVVAFDFDHSGRQDHLLLYRPGGKRVVIVRHDANNGFTAVYTTPSTTLGIGGFDLAVDRDQVVAFDCDHTGRLDCLVVYRPGPGAAVFVVRHNSDNTFGAALRASSVAGFDFSDARDRVVAFDYDHSGRQDHLLMYRPGGKAVVIARNDPANGFVAVYTTPSTTLGIGGFDLAVDRDRVVPFDYEHAGKLDHLVLYRPGNRIVFIVGQGSDHKFGQVFSSVTGIGGFDLAATQDQLVAYDFDHSGGLDYLVGYRPGAGVTRIVGRQSQVAGPAAARGGGEVPPVAAGAAAPAAGVDESIIEDYAYPGAAEIEAADHVTLISGDGHILFADCATPPTGEIGLIEVQTTDPVTANGKHAVCFRVTGPTGRLDLSVPAVFEIRGDGLKQGFGHLITATVRPEGGAATVVAVEPSGTTQVGKGISGGNAATVLLQLKVTGQV